LPKPSRATSVFLDLFQLSPVRPDLKLLGDVAERFARLPWENLTKFIKKHAAPHKLDLSPRLRGVPGAEKLRLSAEVLDDHARVGSGGTCFSLTNALRRISTDLGYRCYPAMADMRHGTNIHCALLVELGDQRYLLDPGYLVAEPVPLRAESTVRVSHPGHQLEYRPVGDGSQIELHTLNDRGEELLRYRLRPRPIPEDMFVQHWLDSFDANGMNGLHLNRVTDEGRLSAHDLNLRIDTGRGKSNVKLRDRYAEQIAGRFGIDTELVRRAHELWEQRRCRDR
jgi:arylamine N-acetyltransferase